MTDKEVYEWLEPVTKYPTMTGNFCECLKVALSALRERIEREDVTDINVGDNWISVEDGNLPPELEGEEEYRCIVSHQRFHDMNPMFSWIDTARFKNGKFYCDEPVTHGAPLMVTHWMPLPKPPK